MTDKEKDAIEYKLVCYYHAKTELYDRTLTDLRSPYDPTEAFITPQVRSQSNAYAKQCHDYIREIGNYFGIKVNVNKYKNFNYTAQNWINDYYLLEGVGEYDFIRNKQI